jgi:predicted DNA-binding transcriptional regulator AlpA
MRGRRDTLPTSLPPRGLSREQAAAYYGVSAGTFDDMVQDGRAPSPKIINRRLVWDRHALDLAFDALPDKEAPRVEFAL